jgi:hypothetical protein
MWFIQMHLKAGNLAFQSFDVERHLMMVILKTRRAHSIWYLQIYLTVLLNSYIYIYFLVLIYLFIIEFRKVIWRHDINELLIEFVLHSY